MLCRTERAADWTHCHPRRHRHECRPSRKYVPASTDLIELAFRTPGCRIGDPAVDVGFMPAGPVGADFELSRKRTLGDLSVDGGPGQPGPGKDGLQADDTVRFAHGCAASC